MTLHVSEPSAKYLVQQNPRAAAVGELPHDWALVKLIDVAEVRGGVAKNANVAISDPIEVAYLRVANVQDGYLDLGDVSKIKISKADLKRYSLLPGDVLMNEGGDLDKLGRGALWRGEIETCVHQNHVFSVRCKQQLLGDYLNVWTGSASARRFFLLAGKQTTNLASISKSSLGEMPVFLPRLEEQRAIAAALSDVDALIAGLEKMIAKKRDLKQAAMQQLLTGQTRLPGFSGEWVVKRLGDVGECLRGVSYKGDADLFPHDTDRSKRLLRSNNVQESLVVTSDLQYVKVDRVREHQILREGDILICMANGSKALVGKAGCFEINDGFEYTFGAFMGAYRGNEKANCRFVFYLFQTGRYRDYITNLLAGSSINNLSPSSIESLEFNFPELAEQEAISQALSDMDGELVSLQSRLAKTRELKQGMMRELLTGKTRLI